MCAQETLGQREDNLDKKLEFIGQKEERLSASMTIPSARSLSPM